MASVIFICNLALSNIGKPSIESLGDADAQAIACNQYYAHVRDTLLQSFPWTFAGKTQVLAEVTNTKANRWQYAYQKPSDCLKIRLFGDETLVDYIPGNDGLVVQGAYANAVEGETIFGDVSPAYLTYTFRLTDPTKFSPMFAEALGWQLAVRLAMPLTRDPKIRADAFQLAERTTSKASELDASEVRQTSDSPSEAIEARGETLRYDAYGRPIY